MFVVGRIRRSTYDEGGVADRGLGGAKMMIRLILGCGYLGERLAAEWRARGDRVFGTTRRDRRTAELRALGVEPIVCDILEPTSLKGLPEVDTVAYCVGHDRAARASMRDVQVGGLANVLDALRGSPRFVHVSSTSVYGQTDGGNVDENAPTEPCDERGRVTLEAERQLQQRRPDAIILRFAGVYGPGRLIRSRDLLSGRLLAVDPEKWLNLIHVEDGARAVVAAAERGRPGATYNVSDCKPVQRKEFYTRLAEVLGAPPPRFVPPPEPVPASERVNRRVVSVKLRRELGAEVRYPTCQEGLKASRSANPSAGSCI